MKNILVLGAGRSSYSLIKYLLDHSKKENWKVTVGDFDVKAAQEKVNGHPNGEAIQFNASDDAVCDQYVSQADVVVSLLPPQLHYQAAKACIKFGKSMINASYVSPEIKALDAEAKEKGILLMNEMGLDPGIDHLSAMKIIDELKAQGVKLLTFKSYTGGLVAPEYDNNPWNYKFTWNPRNVVLAGQGTAKYIAHGQYKYVPYHRVFTDIENINVEGYGSFEGYPNRDSLSYREIYGIDDIPTMIRGTLRKKGFCKSWNVFVHLGMTDDSYKIENSENMTYREFTDSFLPYDLGDRVERKLADLFHENDHSPMMQKLQWLGIFENEKIGLPNASPAQILQHLLEKKWKLQEGDRDMIVMQHIFEYEVDRKTEKMYSSMVVMGDNEMDTAMAKTVGLPLAIAAKLYLKGKIKQTGVQVPVSKDIYEPVLAELNALGIIFEEKQGEALAKKV